MRCQIGCGEDLDVRTAVDQACRNLTDLHPALILFFSDSIQLARASWRFSALFPNSLVMGASTQASFSPAGISCHGICAAAFYDVKVSAGCIGAVTTHPMRYRHAVTQAIEELGAVDLSPDNTCCFVLNPMAIGSEELVMDTIASAFNGLDIPIMGGSASSENDVLGDVSLNGTVYRDSSVFALFHLDSGAFHIVQENLFEPMDNRHFMVTRADVENRILYELNGHPIAEVLCRTLGVDRATLPAALKQHPFGRIPGDQLFIAEFERINPDGSIKTFSRIFNWTELMLLKQRDYRETMRETLDRIRQTTPSPTFSLMVNCASRTRLFYEQGWIEPFTREFAAALGPYIGLSSHGESLSGYYLNWTLLVLSFGES